MTGRAILWLAAAASLGASSVMTAWVIDASTRGHTTPDLSQVPVQTPPPLHPVDVKLRDKPFQAGASILIYGNDPNLPLSVGRLLNRIADLHANSVSFVIPVFQHDLNASEVYADPIETPDAGTIAALVDEAHTRGFRVMLRPLLDVQSTDVSHWRGVITPVNGTRWLVSYRTLSLYYAGVAQDNRIEVFDIGSELGSVESETTYWRSLIGTLRRNYSGKLTYSVNWGRPLPEFSSALDFPSVDAYYPLDVPNRATADQLITAWNRWLPQLRQMAAVSQQPLVVTELGTTSQEGSYRNPWMADSPAPADMAAQDAYYRASCQVLKPATSGIYWWAFALSPSTRPASDRSYDPQGKPAEAAIAQCFS